MPFLRNFGPKCQNDQFKLKFGTFTNSDMQNSIIMFNCFVFDRKYLLWASLLQKIRIINLS